MERIVSSKCTWRLSDATFCLIHCPFQLKILFVAIQGSLNFTLENDTRFLTVGTSLGCWFVTPLVQYNRARHRAATQMAVSGCRWLRDCRAATFFMDQVTVGGTILCRASQVVIVTNYLKFVRNASEFKAIKFQLRLTLTCTFLTSSQMSRSHP